MHYTSKFNYTESKQTHADIFVSLTTGPVCGGGGGGGFLCSVSAILLEKNYLDVHTEKRYNSFNLNFNTIVYHLGNN